MNIEGKKFSNTKLQEATWTYMKGNTRIANVEDIKGDVYIVEYNYSDNTYSLYKD
jgi:hypothetical protein